jgi:hypothetical protein
MSHDSLAKLCNQRTDKIIYSIPLYAKKPEIIYDYEADISRTELFVTPASKQLLWSRAGKCSPTGLQGKYMGPSVT